MGHFLFGSIAFHCLLWALYVLDTIYARYTALSTRGSWDFHHTTGREGQEQGGCSNGTVRSGAWLSWVHWHCSGVYTGRGAKSSWFLGSRRCLDRQYVYRGSIILLMRIVIKELCFHV